jgi:hypothetical protein
MLNKIAVAGLLAFAALPAMANEFRSEYRVDMSEAQFRQANELYFGQGMRLADITVAEVDGAPVIGAIWQGYEQMPAGTAERTKAQLSRVFLKLDADGLKAAGARMGEQGAQVEVIDAYVAGGKTWFAASFAPSGEPQIQGVGAFVETSQLGDMRAGIAQDKQDLLRVDAYIDADKVKTLPVFISRDPTEIEMGTYDRIFAIVTETLGMHLRDMHPMSISVFEKDGQVRWMATWDKGPERWFALLGSKEIAEDVAKGRMVVDLDSRAESDGKVLYFAVVQDKPK